MYKIVFIVIITLIIFSGCSATKEITGEEIVIKEQGSLETVLKTAERNMTNNGFFIQKGKIKTTGESGKISLLFTMKYSPQGKYLISLKSRTGMEAFRVYLSRDTVLVNDRLNKYILFGNLYDFERITGIPAELLKISVGDIFIGSMKAINEGECRDNEMTLDDYYQGLIIKTVIDCRELKVKAVQLSSGITDEYVSISYKKYSEDNYGIPGRIEVDDFRRKTRLVISIHKYSAPWYGEIDFVPGSGYKIKPLI